MEGAPSPLQVADRDDADAANAIDSPTRKKDADSCILRFKTLRLFPPGRNTLVVAEFEASDALRLLHDDVRDVALNHECEELRNVVRRSKERWTAHVTIGDIRGGTKGEVRALGYRLGEGLGLAGALRGEAGKSEVKWSSVESVGHEMCSKV
uniref:Uncharacterized protein n=1 Tax=Odontella aurita TaxID=265563 RepID=A0A7S4MBN1_9STRA